MEWEFCFFREIPAPSDSYQIYSNLQIEFTITVAQAGYYFVGIICMARQISTYLLYSSTTKYTCF